MKGLRLEGLLSHAGHGYHAASEAGARSRSPAREAEILTALRDRAAAAGIASTKSPSARHRRFATARRQRGVTELRPGNYVYFDRTQVALGAAALADCALTVLATVVSKPTTGASSSTAAARR